MKKIALLTVLILLIAFSVTVFAATETEQINFSPDLFWNNGNPLTWTQGTKTHTYPAGTLPTNGAYLNGGGSGAYVDNGTNAPNYGTKYRANGVSAAGPESAENNNAVFKLNNDSVLTDITIATTSPVRRHTVRVNAPSFNAAQSITVNGLSAKYGYYWQGNGTGVVIKEGGAYIKKLASVSGTAETYENIWFVEKNTLATGTWYTVDTMVEFLKDGYVMQNAIIYDEAGSIVGESGWYHVTAKTPTNYWGSTKPHYQFDNVQHCVNGYTGDPVMLDDWKTYTVTGTSRTSFTFEDMQDRKTYKFNSTLALSESCIDNTILDITDAAGEKISKYEYTVSYDTENKKIVIEFTDELPYEKEYTVTFNEEKLLKTEDGYLAFDYSDAAVIATLTETFITPSDPFTVTISADGATVTIVNGDVAAREYMVIASHYSAAGKYLGTKAVYGEATIGTTPITVPSFTTVSGDKITVMVWDNWYDMNAFTDMTEISVQ